MGKKLLTALILTITMLGPHLVDAQSSGKVWRVGLSHVGLDHVPPSLAPLRLELKKLGYEEGKNIQLDWHNLPDEAAANKLAKEFVQSHVDLIVAFESQTARAAQSATKQIPIVVVHVSDPVADGFGASMSRPGGNITGFAGVGDIPAKRMELFKEVLPQLRRLVLLIDPQDPATARILAEARKTAKSFKLQLIEREVTTQADVERVYRAINRSEVDGILAASPTLSTNYPSLMIRLAAERRLPFAGYRKEWVEQGALFSYSHDLAAVGPPAAKYIDRILKGANPGDLPFQEPTNFQFVINLKVAKSLGLTIPPEVLARADKVIR